MSYFPACSVPREKAAMEKLIPGVIVLGRRAGCFSRGVLVGSPKERAVQAHAGIAVAIRGAWKPNAAIFLRILALSPQLAILSQELCSVLLCSGSWPEPLAQSALFTRCSLCRAEAPSRLPSLQAGADSLVSGRALNPWCAYLRGRGTERRSPVEGQGWLF